MEKGNKERDRTYSDRTLNIRGSIKRNKNKKENIIKDQMQIKCKRKLHTNCKRCLKTNVKIS